MKTEETRLFDRVVSILEQARNNVVRSVNSNMEIRRRGERRRDEVTEDQRLVTLASNIPTFPHDMIDLPWCIYS